MTPLEQKLSALEKANVIRRANAELKAELRTRDSIEAHRLAIDVLTNLTDDQPVGCVGVTQFLAAIRGVGRARVGRFTARAGIAPTRRIRELTFRQVQGLVTELDASANQIKESRKAYGS